MLSCGFPFSPLLDHIVPEMARARRTRWRISVQVGHSCGGRAPARSGLPKAFDPAAIYDYTLGAQLNRTYDFTRAVQVAARGILRRISIAVLGPGTTLGAPVPRRR
jgi:hypothetical protein